jgi:hypothetical protein
MVRLIIIDEEVFMRKWLFPIILILAMFLPLSVHAQDPIELSSLQIGLWPEFDKPSVLVIYQMTLSSSTTYPAAVSIRIPITAGEPYALAARQPDGSLFTIDYTPQVAGQWALINFTTTTPEIQLEYYDPGLTKKGTARQFTYTWPGDYAVSQLTIQVQQPTGATNMRISPSLGAGAAGSDGLIYYTQDIGAISAGQKFQISVDYQKSNDVLSAETLPVESSGPIPQGSSTEINLKSWLPWVLGILGAGLIIGGVIWFWESGRQHTVTQARRRRSRVSSYKPESNVSQDEDAIYCSQCGKRAMPGDQFCRFCGSAIRNK